MAHLDANKSTSSTTTQVAAATYSGNQNELNILSNVAMESDVKFLMIVIVLIAQLLEQNRWVLIQD